MFIARHHVCVNDKMFTPGEVITEEIAESKAAFLLEKKAIYKVMDTPIEQNVRAPGCKPDSGESESSSDTKPDDDHAADDEETVEDETHDSDEEAPEIDVMDGIIAEPEPEEATVTAPRKRSKKK